jgi:hypothetical protein
VSILTVASHNQLNNNIYNKNQYPLNKNNHVHDANRVKLPFIISDGLAFAAGFVAAEDPS